MRHTYLLYVATRSYIDSLTYTHTRRHAIETQSHLQKLIYLVYGHIVHIAYSARAPCANYTHAHTHKYIQNTACTYVCSQNHE